jgi:NitT/TauT family transport system substrate-binding protein
MKHPLAVLTTLAVLISVGATGVVRAGASGPTGPSHVRLGFLPNLTQAPALVGVSSGAFQAALGPRTRLRTVTFGAGPAAIEALYSGAIDAAYIGPSPAINAHVRSRGQALRVVAGSTSGGTFLVVRSRITAPDQVRGARLATPQLGGTQDIALRSWLDGHEMRTTLEGSGDVTIVAQDNAQTLAAFRAGAIDGAWVPEPWATRLVREGGGHVLVDERTLWPSGRFPSAVLVVRSDFLRAHREIVSALIIGHLDAIQLIERFPARAQSLVNETLTAIMGKPLPAATLAASWPHLTFTTDPDLSSMAVMARRSEALALLPNDDIATIADLSVLHDIERARQTARRSDR